LTITIAVSYTDQQEVSIPFSENDIPDGLLISEVAVNYLKGNNGEKRA